MYMYMYFESLIDVYENLMDKTLVQIFIFFLFFIIDGLHFFISCSVAPATSDLKQIAKIVSIWMCYLGQLRFLVLHFDQKLLQLVHW